MSIFLTYHICGFLFLIFFSGVIAIPDFGLSCKDHPAEDAPAKSGVLLQSFELKDSKTGSDRIVYLARNDGVRFTPVGDPGSTIYHDLDLFYYGSIVNHPDTKDAVTVYFQRPAKVYLMLNAFNTKAPANVDLPGWKSEGFAKNENPGKDYEYGVHQKAFLPLANYAYVFSQSTSGTLNEITLPHYSWVIDANTGVSTKGRFHIRIAEADGSPVAPPPAFRGVDVEPNKPCPDVVHDAWGTFDNNDEDSDTKGVRFGSWHPEWDPCFWCSFDHDHGSASPTLMKYKPKYGYTEYKNGRGDESNEGFKDFVLEQQGLHIYVSVHAQVSRLRRIHERHHTVTMAVMDMKSDELLLELTTKADFGFLAGKKKDGGVLPITPEGEAIYKEQMETPSERAFRAVNVLDEGNKDPRFKYNGDKLMKGLYEEWSTDFFCTSSKRFDKMKVDVLTPAAGIKDPSGKEAVWLGTTGPEGTDTFYIHSSLKRTIAFGGVELSAEHCGFGQDFEGGYFYTDVYGKELLGGPGPDAVRQFIKPGFKKMITGKFEAEGRWLKLHLSGIDRAFTGIGYGIDPKVN